MANTSEQPGGRVEGEVRGAVTHWQAGRLSLGPVAMVGSAWQRGPWSSPIRKY